ncbi:hypothetical protein M0R19_07980 [Candidatus Pacearchaeota archaeon]|nr:hypothetical protein [Candidatus Pacearchaeota archaeon]
MKYIAELSLTKNLTWEIDANSIEEAKEIAKRYKNEYLDHGVLTVQDMEVIYMLISEKGEN